MILLDTSAVIEFNRGTAQGLRVKELCQEHDVAISAITVNEVLAGKATERELQLVSSINVLPFDRATAILSAQIEHTQREKGVKMSKLDLFIACCALEHGADLLTLDKGFKNVPGLTLRTL